MGFPKKYPNFHGRFFVNNQGIVFTIGAVGVNIRQVSCRKAGGQFELEFIIICYDNLFTD